MSNWLALDSPIVALGSWHQRPRCSWSHRWLPVMRHTTEEQAAEANAAKAAMAPAGADAVAAGRHCPTHFAHDAGPTITRKVACLTANMTLGSLGRSFAATFALW